MNQLQLDRLTLDVILARIEEMEQIIKDPSMPYTTRTLARSEAANYKKHLEEQQASPKC